MEMVNGYVFLDLTKANVYQKALKVLTTDKPVVVSDGSGSPYFVDSMVVDGTSVVITKGGKTITIANDNTITNAGIVTNPTMENIVDLNGNKRFVEGVGVINTIEGVTINYNKWSLSGTHLMIVITGDIADTTQLIGGNLATYELPDYINEKIVPIVIGNDRIDTKQVTLYDAGLGSQTVNFAIDKTSSGIKLYTGSVLLSADRSFRCQFDILIDAE